MATKKQAKKTTGSSLKTKAKTASSKSAASKKAAGSKTVAKKAASSASKKSLPKVSSTKGSMKKATSSASAKATKKTAVKKTTPKAAPKAAPKASAKKTAPKPAAVKKVSAKKGSEKKVDPKANAKVQATKAVAKNAPTPSAVEPASKAVQIAAPSSGKPAKGLMLVKSATAPRRPRRSSESPTPKLEPRVKKTNPKSEEMFERTQSAPHISAPKVTEFPQASHYTTPEPVKPKANVRYSDKDLKMFRELIESEKEKTLDELRMLKERLEDLTNYEASEETAVYSMHMAEQGSEAVEREKTYAQIQRTTDYLRKLDEALTRIDEKTYGICRQCGILIAKERLMAVPITTLSASWKLRQQCPADGIDRIGK